MKQEINFLINIILTTWKSMEIYEIKCKQPEHNKIDKSFQEALKVLITHDIETFNQQLGCTNLLVDEILKSKIQTFQQHNFKSIINKLQFFQNQEIEIEDDLLQKISFNKNTLNNISESLTKSVKKFLEL